MKYPLSNLEGARIPMFFFAHNASDAVDALKHVGIGIAHPVGDESGHLVQEWFLNSDHASVAHRPAHDLTQNITTAVIGRDHAVVDQECSRTSVVSTDPEHDVRA